MSNFFYETVNGAIIYDNKEKQAELYDLTLEGMKSWCAEQMQSVGVPASFIYYTLEDLFAGDSDFGLKLWQYIQGHCKPEPEPEPCSVCAKGTSTKTCYGCDAKVCDDCVKFQPSDDIWTCTGECSGCDDACYANEGCANCNLGCMPPGYMDAWLKGCSADDINIHPQQPAGRSCP